MRKGTYMSQKEELCCHHVVKMLEVSFTLMWESLLALFKVGLFVTSDRVFWSHCLLETLFICPADYRPDLQ